MPAWKLTANCIWNSFRSSGKRHLLLTGDRGSSKTTLLRALAEEISPGGPLPGVTTWVRRGQDVTLKENLTGQAAAIGRFDPALPGTENRMRPVEEHLAGFGAAALRHAAEAPGAWASVDEVGYLETCCPAYCSALGALMERKQLLAAVRRQDLPFLRQLCLREDVFCVNLDSPFGQLGCVIMGSGQGRRFGGNKLLACLEGKPLIQYALDATAGIFARRVVVTRHPEVAALCRAEGAEVLLHDLPRRSDTVRLGLEALTGEESPELTGCLFCPADQPLLRWQTVAALALCGVCRPEKIWRTAWQGQPGAPVLFPRWSFPELLTLPEGKGGGAVLRRYPERVGLVPAAEPGELADVDRPEDLDVLAAWLAQNRLS